MAVVVGLDPGLQRTGYAVVARQGSRVKLLEAGVIRIAPARPLAVRLDELHRAAVELLEEHRPDALAVEEIFSHYERPRTAILMGHARGVLLLAAGAAGIEVESYPATRVKKTLTGSGRASKEQMQQAVRVEFGLDQPLEPPDVADAVAVALCHIHAQRALSQLR